MAKIPYDTHDVVAADVFISQVPERGLFCDRRPDLSDCPTHKLERSKRQSAEIGSEGPMGRFLTRGSKSHNFVDELKPLLNEIVLGKPGKGALHNRGMS